MAEITETLGLEPTNQHRKGEKKGPKSPPFKSDMWSFKVKVHENEPLHKHIDTLWSLVKPNKEYLLSLKKNLNVDIFLGYRSNHDHAGIEVPYKSLDMFRENRTQGSARGAVG